MNYLGIDPGVSGAWAIVNSAGQLVASGHFSDPSDVIGRIRTCRHIDLSPQSPSMVACIEKVHAMPGQGVSSMFTLGENFGLWQGILHTMGIPFEMVTPAKWQRAVLDFLPEREKPAEGEDEKACARRRAENRKTLKAAIVDFVRRRFPSAPLLRKKDSDVADAICIALYARKQHGVMA
jgi:crossover junction endodeoxyribonuclease RuvC